MDDRTLGRIAELEADVMNLRKDMAKLNETLNKLIASHCERNEICGEVSRVVTELARAQCDFGETLDDTFRKAFPEHGRYLDAIEYALERATKRLKP